MSVAEIIEQIKALPHEEQRRVLDFMTKTEQSIGSSPIRFASDEQARQAGDSVVAQYPDVFKRLAE